MIKTSKTIKWINKKVLKSRSRYVETKVKISSEPFSSSEILFDDYVVYRRPGKEVEDFIALFYTKNVMKESTSDDSVHR